MLVEGLYVMVLGMGLVFLSLVILMFAMMGLERAFRLKTLGEDDAVVPSPASEEPLASVAPSAVRSVDLKISSNNSYPEVAAAIACALARAQAEAAPSAVALSTPDGEEGAREWDWLWDEGIDDYGTTRESHYANV